MLIGMHQRLRAALCELRSCHCKGRCVQLQVLHSMLAGRQLRLWCCTLWHRVGWLKGQRVGLWPCCGSLLCCPQLLFWLLYRHVSERYVLPMMATKAPAGVSLGVGSTHCAVWAGKAVPETLALPRLARQHCVMLT